MKNKILYLLILLPMLFGCESSTMPPANQSYTLSAEKVACTDAWLKVSLNNTTLPKLLFMKAGNQDGYSLHQITAKDTLLHFTGLTPGREYTYSYYVADNYALSNDGYNNSSNILTIRTPDTTSYNFTWNTSCIGAAESLVNGIWGSSSNDVWAVGRFYNANGPTSYLAHYDGNGWTQTYSSLFSDSVKGLHVGTLKGIYGLSPDKMWVVGSAYGKSPFTNLDSAWAFAAFWNKNEWQDISPKLPDISLRKVWAYDENNVWAVGTSGRILYYNGKTWTEQCRLTGYYLNDINGTDPENLYAVGNDNNNYSSGILLKFTGTGWQRVPVSTYEAKSPFQSIWVESDKSIWIAGRFILIRGNGKGDWDAQPSKDYLFNIRGLAGNDIYTGGYRTVGHFNGKTLNLNNSIYTNHLDYFINDILVFKDKVFFAGDEGLNGNGVIITGTK